MKQTPKCSLCYSLSSDTVTNVALAKVCILQSARSSLMVFPTFVGQRLCFGLRVFIYALVCMYVCYQLFPKSTRPNCMKFSGMICHHPRTNGLDSGSDQVKRQCQGHRKVKNYWTELHEIFRDDLSSSKDQLIRFWEQSGQMSRSRLQKGQNWFFVITCSVFFQFIWDQHQKCSLFNSLSSDMVTNVALAKVCALPSARSNLLASPTFVGRRLCFGPHVFIYSFIGLYVCTLPTHPENYSTELYEIFRDDLSSSKD